MRPTRTTMAAVCAALVLAVLPSTLARASGAEPVAPVPDKPRQIGPEPTLLVGETPTAQQALAAVVAAFSHGNAVRPRGASAHNAPFGGDLTMTMLLLHRQFEELSPTDQRVAERYLARPDDFGGDPEGFGYARGSQVHVNCTTNVCVNWVTTTADAPPPADRNGNGRPDQVDRTQGVMSSVWDRIVTQGGYKKPLPDLGKNGKEGRNPKFDVYLADLGSYGYYGYCAPDSTSTRNGFAARGYCVLDNDYRRSEFPTNTPTENLQVTAAHEFFHAVQFAYDFLEDWWFMEGTAAWIEDELYDAVNDNLQYLNQSQLRRPDVPLDYTSNSWLPYGSWIFWRYLTERFPAQGGTGLPTIMRDIWQRADDSTPSVPGTYSLRALERALTARGTSFTRVYAGFAEANRHPKNADHAHYEEGSSYPNAPLVKSYTLSRARTSIGWQSVAMRQLSSQTVAFRPGAGLAGNRWKLRAKVNAPSRSRGSFVQVVSYRKGGTIATNVVRLKPNGVGAKAVRFSTPEVVRVELSLVNASTRYKCNRGTNASCGGVPRDSGLATKFRVRLFR